MVVQILLLLIGVLLLIVTMQGGFIRQITFFNRGGGFYPSGHGGGGEGSRGFFILLIIIAMIGVLIWINKVEVGNFFDGLDAKVMRGDVSGQSRAPSSKEESTFDGVIEESGNVAGTSDHDGELASLGEDLIEPVVAPIVSIDEPAAKVPKSARWGYQFKCGEVAAFVGEEVVRLRKDYHDAKLIEIPGDSPYKVVLFTAETRDEVIAWKKAHPQLQKGYLRRLPG